MSDDPMRWVWRAVALGALVIGWIFILVENHFTVTAPVVVVCLAYFAVVATVANLWRVGAAAVAPEDATAEAWSRPLGERGELEKEKKTLLKAIKEAEFDHEMGKLSKVDAAQLIGMYRARAIEVIKELERMDHAEAENGPRVQIQREIAARLALEEEAGKKGKGKAKGKGAAANVAAKADAKSVDKAAAKSLDKADAKPEPKVDEAAAKADEAAAKADKADAKTDEKTDKAAAKTTDAKADEAAAKTDAKADEAAAKTATADEAAADGDSEKPAPQPWPRPASKQDASAEGEAGANDMVSEPEANTESTGSKEASS